MRGLLAAALVILLGDRWDQSPRSDLAATIYRPVGVDPEMIVHDLTGRPNPIKSRGRPIEGILA